MKASKSKGLGEIMTESTQHILDKVRPPRVHITYDVQIGDAIEMKELPFVMGVLADLSGQPENPLPKPKDRKFVNIDGDNFDDIMASIAPRLALRVQNALSNDDTMLNVLLNFKSMDDFNPVNVVKQVGPLAQLYDARTKLSDLLSKLDGNDDLDALLLDVIENSATQNELKKELGVSGGDAKPGAGKPPKKGS